MDLMCVIPEGSLTSPDEYLWFAELTREAGAGESPEAFVRVFKRVVKAPAAPKRAK